MAPSLDTLPTELLYEIQLYSLSEHFPYTNRRLRSVFSSCPASLKASYLCYRCISFTQSTDEDTHTVSPSISLEDFHTQTLRYPICSIDVLRFLLRYTDKAYPNRNTSPPLHRSGSQLPKHPFRNLAPRTDREWAEHDEPMPFLRSLDALATSHKLRLSYSAFSQNAGYALTKAVQAAHVPLIRYLLGKGATPGYKDNLAVRVAIRKGDLRLVRLLIERESEDGEAEKGKRRKLSDRIMISKMMLRLAVKCAAKDIVDYFVEEKGVVPDMGTIYLMN